MSELSEAIDTVYLWADQWANTQSEVEEADPLDEEERQVIKAMFVVLRAAKSTLPATPQNCPHAGPHRYCDRCKVTPCPIGLATVPKNEATA